GRPDGPDHRRQLKRVARTRGGSGSLGNLPLLWLRTVANETNPAIRLAGPAPDLVPVATAAVAAATAAAAAAVAAAAPVPTAAAVAAAAGAAAGLAGLGLVHLQVAVLVALPVERLDRGLGLRLVRHHHEREAARAARLAVHHDVDVGDLAVLG